VLPGEIVRQCVANIQSGVLNPVAQLNMTHLIVDEFQDFNPIDLMFVGALMGAGVTTFVAGDDDQSVYSFRYASPTGIQTFATTPPGTNHVLADCFRCTPAVVTAATAVVTAHPLPNRIPKALNSLYAAAAPPLAGSVFRWRFPRENREAQAIAESCRDLIAAGVPASEILILLSNKRLLGQPIVAALEAAGVPFDPLNTERYLDTRDGRFVFSCLRIACDDDDYIAHRTLLGTLPGVGITTSRGTTDKVVSQNQNYKDIFYAALPAGVFSARETNALARARAAAASMAGWQGTDTLVQRGAALEQLLDKGSAMRLDRHGSTRHFICHKA
jgi:superfamily I DNA/RNA helicase